MMGDLSKPTGWFGGGNYDYSATDLFANPLGPGLGKPSSAQKAATTEALINSTKVPWELWKNTSKIRGNITKQLEDFTSGNTDLSQMPMYAPAKAGVEDSYNTAKQNILENTPAGGSLSRQLTSLEQSRARGLTDAIGKIQQDLLDKSYGVGYGTPQASISGGTAAAGNLSAATSAQEANANANARSLGTLIGTMATK
jgi:hypothetical protein